MDSPAQRACGIAAGRLNLADYAANFSDAHPALNRSQALIEAERCYYCYDAPCTTACPTSIDVPAFIARIAQDNVRGAAREILTANPLGGMCSPRLSHGAAVRAGLRAQHPGRQAGRNWCIATLCDRCLHGLRWCTAVPACRRHGQEGGRGRAGPAA